MKPVRFLRDFSPYAAGEVAGFDEAKAEDLIRRGFAERYVTEEEEAVEAESEEDEVVEDDEEEDAPARPRRRRRS